MFETIPGADRAPQVPQRVERLVVHVHRVGVRRVVQTTMCWTTSSGRTKRCPRATPGTARRCRAPPMRRSAYDASTRRSTPPATRSTRSSKPRTSM
jgi:hypothetical protein